MMSVAHLTQNKWTHLCWLQSVHWSQLQRLKSRALLKIFLSFRLDSFFFPTKQLARNIQRWNRLISLTSFYKLFSQKSKGKGKEFHLPLQSLLVVNLTGTFSDSRSTKIVFIFSVFTLSKEMYVGKGWQLTQGGKMLSRGKAKEESGQNS